MEMVLGQVLKGCKVVLKNVVVVRKCVLESLSADVCFSKEKKFPQDSHGIHCDTY